MTSESQAARAAGAAGAAIDRLDYATVAVAGTGRAPWPLHGSDSATRMPGRSVVPWHCA